MPEMNSTPKFTLEKKFGDPTTGGPPYGGGEVKNRGPGEWRASPHTQTLTTPLPPHPQGGHQKIDFGVKNGVEFISELRNYF